MAKTGGHGVVLGASIAGMLAARVLSDHFDTVTIVERDVLGDAPENRRGVAQGRHLHGLLLRGAQSLDELFPGFLDELVADGAPCFDGSDLSRLYFCMNGHLGVRSGSSQKIRAYGSSRPFLEYHIRRRLRAMPNIAMLDAHDFVDLTTTAQRDRVIGVSTASHDGNKMSQLPADLVVDATGRGARTPVMLERLGYGRPAEDKVTVHLKYSTQLFRLPPGALREMGMVVSPVPGRPRGLALAQCEHDTHMVTLFGMAGDDPPDTFSEMLEYAGTFVPPQAMAALEAATPLAPPTQYRYPSSRWYRYDRAQRLPDGLLVVGDAVCSFNPIYAQGMTVAALEALALQDCLAKGTADLPRRFFRASAKPIRQAWQLAVGGDLSLPEIEGSPPLATRLMNPYIDRILTAAEYDISVLEQFIRVAWLVDSPAKLMRPAMIARAITAKRRRPAAEPETTTVQRYSTLTGAWPDQRKA
jgi:2-polyprenyl-6-methoxyphenol hydroxylase-like FAD-dependent oxidoreductase